MTKIGIRLIISLLAVAAVGCATIKPFARDVNDAARIACEVAFGEERHELGLSRADVKKLCQEHDRIAPFIDAIFSARQEVAAGVEGGGD